MINTSEYSLLLEQHLPLIKKISAAQNPLKLKVLDLACGSGRNGGYLLENGIDVCFADINKDALEVIQQQLTEKTDFWPVDFEQENQYPLQQKSFAGIMVFRYLHRPLFDQIKEAIIPGGFVIYETFTVEQAQFGRPKNPKFLLQEGELETLFSDWEILHSFEGVVETSDGKSKQAIAQIVAVKPS